MRRRTFQSRHLNERLDACVARVCDAVTGWNALTPVDRDVARIWPSVDRDGKNIDRRLGVAHECDRQTDRQMAFSNNAVQRR